MKTYQILLGILFLVLIALGVTLLTRSQVEKPQPREQKLGTKPEAQNNCQTLTPSLTEGPYYKTGSPQRTNLTESTTVGEKLAITGLVMDTNCKPIPGAWLDFWQADGDGNYDNVAYKLRGHQFTDSEGKYKLETVIPGKYSRRTPHIHVKVRASENSEILTTQLFLPNKEQNQRDTIFNEALVMKVVNFEDDIKQANFNFHLAD